jgi:hypothetical protein
MREDVVPFVTAGAFFTCIFALIGGYGLYRKFFVKKTDFEGYDPNAEGGGGGEVYEESHEMSYTNGGGTNGHQNGTTEPQYVHAAEEPTPDVSVQTAAKPKGGANPFTKGQASNPFRGDGV